MSHANGHRWSKFWWQDWANDPALRCCSLAAQGLWMRFLCIMHEAQPRGYLLIDGEPPSAKYLSIITGATLRELKILLDELKVGRVYSTDVDGRIFCRRMVRDTAASEYGARTGKLGGNPALLAKTNGKGDDDPPDPKQAPRRPNYPQPDNHTPYPPPLTQPVNQNPQNPYGGGLTSPVKLEAEADSEGEREEKKKESLSKNLSVAARDRSKPIAAPQGADPPSDAVGPGAVGVHVRRIAKAHKLSVPYGQVRSPSELRDAVDPPERWRAKPIPTDVLATLRRNIRQPVLAGDAP